ncbi:CHAT domain-containing protein [Fulvivirga lutea]|uniref:CHAT domain-containing protein n=1 Tax=Fulvivirga lutea TaxID=2810512 RepID=A0A974ZZJ2_9BACT|nr:CHAT domain-containing tetratricopeptide repeat protein [Fulvivirga lutea]QSE96279.1 CHAT domain-containing protein [Fulvivirga lutea]
MAFALIRTLLLFLAVHLCSYSFAQNLTKLSNKAVEAYKEGRFEDALEQCDKALKKLTSNNGEQSELLISCLKTKAMAQSALGLHEDALENLRAATKWSKKVYQLPHYSHIEQYNEFAKLFITLAKYDSADYYLQLAMSGFQSIKDQNEQHYQQWIHHLNNLLFQTNGLQATVLSDKGKTEEAINTLKITLPWYMHSYPETYSSMSNYQLTINNVATYYNEIGELDSARKYALHYYDLIANSRNPLDKIHAIQNLGSIERNAGNLNNASRYWADALSLIETSNMDNNYIHMVILNNLGELYIEIEDYEQAIESFNKSLNIQRSRQAINPPLYQTTISNLAVAQHWSGKYAQADSTFNILIDNLLDEIRHNFTYLSDEEKLSFYKQQLDFIDNYKSFAFEAGNFLTIQESEEPYVNPDITGRLYDLQISTKAIILNASKRMRQAILNAKDAELVASYEFWEQSKNKLARLLNKENNDPIEIENLKFKIEQYERWLTNHSRSFRSGFVVDNVSWQKIQQKLKPNEAAVEMINFFDGLIYGALILTSETKDRPVMSLVMSTQSKHLDKQYFQQYRNAITYQMQDTISYKTYWQPIIDSIQQYMPQNQMPKRIYFSNDGIYNQINLNTLYNTEENQFVLDETDIIILTNTKELLEADSPKSASKKAVLFGEPKFSKAEKPTYYDELPATGVEVKKIEQLLRNADWQPDTFLEEHASEGNLKSIENPYLIHIATHGYFKPTEGHSSFIEAMMSSGLVMSGVEDDQLHEDGLLTSYEMLNLNLDSTELVVLSACETAKGTESHGEGVYGLQRALRVSGAKHLVMSLWQVDDEATQKLMTHFYTYWTNGTPMRESLRLAQQELRKKYPSPYYWGAFILTGI